MRALIQEIRTVLAPESLVENLSGEPGIVLLRTSAFDSPSARYSFVAANPFLTFRSFGSRCEMVFGHTPNAPRPAPQIQFGNPWHLLDALMARFELLDEIDLPFPLGGCFGYWGYDLKNFTEPKLRAGPSTIWNCPIATPAFMTASSFSTINSERFLSSRPD
jgi:anthranilate/para-aminobenzoate synthase component I